MGLFRNKLERGQVATPVGEHWDNFVVTITVPADLVADRTAFAESILETASSVSDSCVMTFGLDLSESIEEPPIVLAFDAMHSAIYDAFETGATPEQVRSVFEDAFHDNTQPYS